MPSAAQGEGSRQGRRSRLAPISFGDFVDDALFHPRWGYYSTGGVQFGTGGHYDTYPLALSPLFGHMVAHYAHAAWLRAGAPGSFELCELGAGNGQLCLDTLLWVHERARHDRSWKRFATRLRYRIVERSPSLAARQRQQLGPLAEAVVWSRCDPSRRAPQGVPFAERGLIIANEVLDCLPHEKILPRPGGFPAVAAVVPSLGGRSLDRARLAAAMADPRRRQRVRFREATVPLSRLPALATYAERRYPELFSRRPPRLPHFACPRFDTLMRSTATFYERADALWIDYGAERDFHRRAPEARRLFAGAPRSGRGVYDDPGRDDITFLVDFTAVVDAARDAGWAVAYYGPQAALARLGKVALDRAATELVIRHRALRWMLALAGVGPEQSWQRPAVTWSSAPATGRVPVRRYVEQSVREFRDGQSLFKLLVLRTAADPRSRGRTLKAISGRRTSAARRPRR
jgi:SAM-dependent MidA family methyltransferase